MVGHSKGHSNATVGRIGCNGHVLLDIKHTLEGYLYAALPLNTPGGAVTYHRQPVGVTVQPVVGHGRVHSNATVGTIATNGLVFRTPNILWRDILMQHIRRISLGDPWHTTDSCLGWLQPVVLGHSKGQSNATVGRIGCNGHVLLDSKHTLDGDSHAAHPLKHDCQGNYMFAPQRFGVKLMVAKCVTRCGHQHKKRWGRQWE